MIDTIVLSEGKYVVTSEQGILKAYRHGELWQEKELVGNNLLGAMVNEILDLREQLKRKG